MISKRSKYMGFLGVCGLLAFRFFVSGDVNDLGYLGYFGFFAYFIVAKISGNRADERYREDAVRAQAFTGSLALVEMAATATLGIAIPALREYLPVLLFACFASLLIAYAVRFYTLEEK